MEPIDEYRRACPITQALANQRATAIAGADNIDPALDDAMAEALGHMARGMINFGQNAGRGATAQSSSSVGP